MAGRLPVMPNRVRGAVLKTASDLFYREGVRAVGMDLIVERSGIAKTTIYRHFPTKDALVEAFLDGEDADFWRQWDEAVAPYVTAPLEALHALCDWVGAKLARDLFRGCPQINVAAEFADQDHPARRVGRRHKAGMIDRLKDLCSQLDGSTADLRGQQIALLFDGAFMSDGRLREAAVGTMLKDAIDRLLGPLADTSAASDTCQSGSVKEWQISGTGSGALTD